MADDTNQTGKPDDTRININQPHELRYWSGELGISENELRKIVANVGPMVKDVRQNVSR